MSHGAGVERAGGGDSSGGSSTDALAGLGYRGAVTIPRLFHQSWRDAGFPKDMFNWRWQVGVCLPKRSGLLYGSKSLYPSGIFTGGAVRAQPRLDADEVDRRELARADRHRVRLVLETLRRLRFLHPGAMFGCYGSRCVHT